VSLGEDALVSIRRRAQFLAVASGKSTAYRLHLYATCTALALVCTYVLGKDMPWDMLHYHLYAGFSAAHDRFAQDYFAAGPQSYFNPYVYVPFYALVSIGLPALVIASLLAVVHSAVLWLTFELAACVSAADERRTRLLLCSCAVALAFLNPIFIQELGSSFADITTAVPVLCGWLLLALAVRAPRAAYVGCAGLLLGAATAFKFTNATHALAAFVMLVMLPRPMPVLARYVAGFAGTLALGFALVGGPWCYRLMREFGNPLFPLMNGVFRSPEFTVEPLRAYRFIPQDLGAALWRPFSMIDPVPMLHVELRAPDLRYAALVVLGGALLVRWLWQRRPRNLVAATPQQAGAAQRVLAALSLLLAVDWVAYLCASGNSRYCLPMASVAAVIAVTLVFRLFAARPRVRNYVLCVILGAQAFQTCVGADHRWNPAPWDGPWFKVDVPPKLATQPDLYLTIGVQSNAFLAAFLARGSGLINFSGGYALGPQGASGRRIEALIRRYDPNLRVLVRGARLYADQEHGDASRPLIDGALERFALRVDMTDCQTIAEHGPSPEFEITFGTPAPQQPLTDMSYFVSCRVVHDATGQAQFQAAQRDADVAFDHLEDACPQVFQPRRMQTEHFGSTWLRNYRNTDVAAWLNHGQVEFRNAIRGGGVFHLGRESDWVRALQPTACGRRDGRYFANLLQSAAPP
jgi:hypothetical protein